jgi:hypothetical protein
VRGSEYEVQGIKLIWLGRGKLQSPTVWEVRHRKERERTSIDKERGVGEMSRGRGRLTEELVPT